MLSFLGADMLLFIERFWNIFALDSSNLAKRDISFHPRDLDPRLRRSCRGCCFLRMI